MSLTTFTLPVHPALEDDFKRSHIRGIVDLLAKSFTEADPTKWKLNVDKAGAGLYDVIIHAPLDRYHSVLLTMPNSSQEGSTHAILAKFLLGNITDRLAPSKRIDHYCDMNLDNNVWSDFIGWVSLAKAKYEEVRFPRRFMVMTTFVGHAVPGIPQDPNQGLWMDFGPGIEMELFPWPEHTFVRRYIGLDAAKPFDPRDGRWYCVKTEKEEQDIIQRGWVVPRDGWDDHHMIPEIRKGQS